MVGVLVSHVIYSWVNFNILRTPFYCKQNFFFEWQYSYAQLYHTVHWQKPNMGNSLVVQSLELCWLIVRLGVQFWVGELRSPQARVAKDK